MTDRRRCRRGRNFMVRSSSSCATCAAPQSVRESRHPASAALGQSRTDLEGEETPPSRQEKPAASAFLCVPQALSLRPRVSRASDPRSGFWRQLARGAGCTLTARDPPLPSRELRLPGSPQGAAVALRRPGRWPFFPAGPLPPRRSPALLGGLGRTGRGGDTRVSTRVRGAGGVPLFSRTVRTATLRGPLFTESTPPLLFVPEGAPAGFASERSHNPGEVGLGGDSGCPLSSKSLQPRRHSCRSKGGGEVGDRYSGGKVRLRPHPSPRPALASQPRPAPGPAPPRAPPWAG